MKIGIYVSNNATTIKKILKFLNKFFPEYLKKFEYIFIDNENNEELRKLTLEYNIKLLEKNTNKEEVSDVLFKLSKQYGIDYLFVFGKRILKGELLEKYRNKIINFHPAILPSFKGIKAIDQALETDVILLGNTAHFIDENIDEGIMIMQALISRKEVVDYYSVLNLQVFMFVQILEWFEQNKIEILENKIVSVKNAAYKVESFIPNLENILLIEKYKEYQKNKEL